MAVKAAILQVDGHPRDLKEYVREDDGFKVLDQKLRKFKCRIAINRSKRAFSHSRTSSECGSLSG